MALPLTHILFTIVLSTLVIDYLIKKEWKKYFTFWTIFVAGFATVLPDFDNYLVSFLNLLGKSFSLIEHRGITHTLLFALIFLIPAFILWKKKNRTFSVYFFAATFGILSHLFLDWFWWGTVGIMLFWPITNQKFMVDLIHKLGIERLQSNIDSVLILLWILYEEFKHRIHSRKKH